ncbi:MAG TPA: NUDIX hydrolase [Candidatus Saccharimonadales bacterium]|nr:NUDIX hydrolase [Candidatus Saccharimonadales bacterium]
MSAADQLALQPWELLSTKDVLQTKWFTIHEQQMRTPTGADATYYVHDSLDSVICLCLTPDNKIILEKQYRPPIERVSYDFPSGSMEPEDQDPAAGIKRELHQELGFQSSSLTEIGVMDTNPGFSKVRVHVFLAHGEMSEPSAQEPTERVVPVLVSPAELLQYIDDGKLACTFCISTTFLAFRHLGLLPTNLTKQ